MYRFLLAVFKWLSPYPWIQRIILRLFNTRFLVGVVGLILDQQGKVVLFHHTYRNKYPWGFPGGWMTRGEQPAVALVREVTEESGLTIKVEGPLEVCAESDLPFLEIVMKCELVAGDFQPSDEVDRAMHVDADNIPEDMRQAQKQIILNYLSKKDKSE